MSLIPSESYSFPDNYSPVAARRSRVLKEKEPASRPVNRVENVVLPPPITVENNFVAPEVTAEETNGHGDTPQNDVAMFFQAFGKIAEQNTPPSAPEVSPPAPMAFETNVVPPPPPGGQEMFFQALGRLVGPPAVPPAASPEPPEPPRIPFSPRKVRPAEPPAENDASLSTANGHGRSRNLRPKTPPHALQYLATTAIQKAEPGVPKQAVERPAIKEPATPPVTEPLEDYDWGDPVGVSHLRERRRKKIARFCLLEFVALAVLIPSAGVVLSHDLTNRVLVMLMNILTISAAVAVALIPIMLFAVGPAFTRDRRM